MRSTGPDGAWAVVAEELGKPGTAWSIGVRGAIAEFLHTDAAPSRRLDQWTVASDLGAIRVTPARGATLLAYEEPGAGAESWAHGVAVCLPAALDRVPNRSITELGVDQHAIDPRHRAALLFDLGLGAAACDFCVRVSEPAQIRELRGFIGRSAFDPEVMRALVSWQPHRVVTSVCGRIEIYQPIGTEKTPEGPHTHLLPKIFRSDAVTSANVPLPRGYTAGLILYPENPVRDRLGRRKPFSEAEHAAFQELLALYGDPSYVRAKYAAELGTASVDDSRLARLAERIARRQALARGKALAR